MVPETPEEAAFEMEAMDHDFHLGTLGTAFIFFADVDNCRGCVLYRRYDGHYGLVIPAADTAAS